MDAIIVALITGGMLRCWHDYYSSDNIPPYRTAHGHRAGRD